MRPLFSVPFVGDLVAPLAVALTAGLSVGCSANVTGQTDLVDADQSSSPLAVVVVERTVAASDNARAEAVARFVRMRSGAVDQDALRMVGATVDVPDFGSCAAVSTLGRGRHVARAVELLDVGSVTLETNGVATTLPARRLPDVADLVSGVVYARAADTDAMPALGRYELKITGAAEIAPFAMAGYAPGEPAELKVAGKDARQPGVVELPHTGGVELTWEPGASDDFVYVDVVGGAGSLATGSSVRCLFADGGRAVLGAAAFGSVEDGTLSVHRVHRERFRARGIEAGELRFDFARAVPFTRR